MSDEQKSQPFLSRWSQRKMQRQEEADETDIRPVSHPLDAQQDESSPKVQPQESPPLPDIDSLDEHSDYSAFLAPEVSEDLQRMALRKLFTSSRFNVRDGLDDYDEDYRSFHSLGDTVTAEMRHRLERERERLSDKAEAEPLETPESQQAHAGQQEESSNETPQNKPENESGTA